MEAFARVGGAVGFLVSAVLLTSIGGAGIVASPVTLPLMYLAVRAHPTPAFRVAGIVIGGLTAFLGGWGLGVLVFGYNAGGAWLSAWLAAGVMVAACAGVRRTELPASATSS